ncbi:hypothetical protein [Candidatus Poriferisodalis sp.]|uniref:hypothetical protein n=1 Tax=Candidatus Poriferisodalis sp. TaxID=3101277 RepID=UPI003B5CA28C
MKPRADTSDSLIRQRMARIKTGYRIGRDIVLRNIIGEHVLRMPREPRVPRG